MNISASGLSYRYASGVQALDDVSLAMAAGEAVAVVGENGAGKTTLVKHFNGLLKPTAGRVQVGDWDTAGRTTAQLAARVGYVFQNPDEQLFERTVQAEVSFGPRNLGCSGEEVQARVQQALALVGLEDQAKAHPYDLQASQRKLLALAAILAMQTPVLILDEPTTGQDASGVARLADIVETLKAEGRTVIAISHDLDFCAEHFPRMVVMSQGRVLADGPTTTVLAQTDVLAQAQVEAPQLQRLAARLGLRGPAHTLEAFMTALAERKGRIADCGLRIAD